MALIAEFTAPADLFAVGRALDVDADLTVELGRIVPTGEGFIPFLWVYGDTFDAIEANLTQSPGVDELDCIAELTDKRLYHIDRGPGLADWLQDLMDLEFTIIEGRGTAVEWTFEIRFPSNEAASAFQTFLTERDIPHSIEKVHQLQQVSGIPDNDVTAKQREALLLAYQQGYYERPQQTTLAELADELDLAASSVSDRLRRGHKTLIHSAFSGHLGDDTDELGCEGY